MSVDVLAVVYAAAKSTWHKYRAYADLEDLQQDAYLWMLDHQPLIDRHLEADSDRVGEYRVMRDCAIFLEKSARAAKASVAGYEPDDESWYSAGVLALVLPKVLTGDRSQPSAVTDGMPRTRKDGAESGTWMAMYADVSKALKALESDDVHLLVDRHLDELSYDAIAQRWEWASSTTAQTRVKRAEGRLIDQLGGYRPKDCPPGCEHWNHDESLRRRPNGYEEIY
jgi:hypothetical protein